VNNYYHLTEKSTNVKTGFIPVITSSKSTCPKSCPLKHKGCYAKFGPLGIHWNKVSNGERGYSFKELLKRIKNLYEKLIEKNEPLKLRLWQAGDLPGVGRRINGGEIKQLVDAVKDFDEVYGYTHKPLNKENVEYIKYCNDNGMTINLSANSLEHADELYKMNIAPVVVTLPIDAKKNTTTPNGVKVIVCPAAKNKDTTCDSCGGKQKNFCARANRNFIIGFPAHGTQKRLVGK